MIPRLGSFARKVRLTLPISWALVFREMLHKMCIRDREKREEYIQAQLAKSQQDNSVSSAVGNWNVTTVTTGAYEMTVSDFLMYGGMPGAQMHLEIYETGRFYLDILGEAGEGTWAADDQESGRYILSIDGDTQAVTIDAAGKLNMDLEGVLLKFEKETSA